MKEEIKQFIADNFLFDDPSKIQDDISLIDNAIIDSTGIVQLVDFVEENFVPNGIEVEEIIPENFDSIDKITTFINSKIQ